LTIPDTSVWIGFFRGARSSQDLGDLLEADEVLLHPFVRGELSLGYLGAKRSAVLRDLSRLPSAPLIAETEVLEMVEVRSLSGSGMGWVDAHLLASALVSRAVLWTFDRPLVRAASQAGISQF
jgi:predicted nucleic acid-binding protein